MFPCVWLWMCVCVCVMSASGQERAVERLLNTSDITLSHTRLLTCWNEMKRALVFLSSFLLILAAWCVFEKSYDHPMPLFPNYHCCHSNIYPIPPPSHLPISLLPSLHLVRIACGMRTYLWWWWGINTRPGTPPTPSTTSVPTGLSRALPGSSKR